MRPKHLDKIFEAVHKPNSVLGNHLSWIPIARNLNRPTRESNEAGNFSSLIWSFSRRGLPCHLCHQRCGELLPHLFTLTQELIGAVYFLWHFPSSHEDWVLPSVLPYRVRTFLIPPMAGRDCTGCFKFM